MLKPGNGKIHRAYLWAYSPGAFEDMRAVIYDFTETRSGKNAEAFLRECRGKFVFDDYSGYKATLANGVTECGCLAHARRKFFDLRPNNNSHVAGDALMFFRQHYEVKRELQDLDADASLHCFGLLRISCFRSSPRSCIVNASRHVGPRAYRRIYMAAVFASYRSRWLNLAPSILKLAIRPPLVNTKPMTSG